MGVTSLTAKEKLRAEQGVLEEKGCYKFLISKFVFYKQ